LPSIVAVHPLSLCTCVKSLLKQILLRADILLEETPYKTAV
jgi:hypothetical protein